MNTKTTPRFDADTAQHFNRRPGGSRHHAYIDANGSICLWCFSNSLRGGVAVSLKALEWLREQDGEKFVRLTNANHQFDVTVPLDQLPEKEPRDGYAGPYFIVDPEDLENPDFSPVDSGKVPF